MSLTQLTRQEILGVLNTKRLREFDQTLSLRVRVSPTRLGYLRVMKLYKGLCDSDE